MGSAKSIFYSVIIVAFLISCSTRQGDPVVTSDNTTIYLGKNPNYISANIKLGRKLGKTSATPLFQGIVFPIGENEKVIAVVNIENYTNVSNKPQMFHIEWVNPDGTSVFKKETSQIISDTLNNIISSVTTDLRMPGNYQIRVYHFRELIAEKQFKLIPEQLYNDSILKKIGAEITFCKSIHKLNGDRLGVDTIFYSGKRNWINAIVDFKNKPLIEDESLKYFMEWIAPDSQVTYNKRLTFTANDTAYVVKSSISTNPEKRHPGRYSVNIYLYKQLIAQKSFLLLPEKKPEILILKKSTVQATITLCQNYNKQTHEKSGIGSHFSIGTNERIWAIIDLSRGKLDKKSNISVHWINDENKTFFKKSIDLNEFENLSEITSSISAESKSRNPGTYTVRVYNQTSLIAERKFEILEK